MDAAAMLPPVYREGRGDQNDVTVGMYAHLPGVGKSFS